MSMPFKAIFSMGPRIWLRWNWVDVGLPWWTKQKWACKRGWHLWNYRKTLIRKCERCKKLQHLQTGIWKWDRGQLRWSHKYGFYRWADGKIGAEWKDL